MTEVPSPNAASTDMDSVRVELKAIYNDYRTTVLNRKYYGWRVDQYTRLNFWFEVVIAVGASGSGVAGFALWQTNFGKYVWATISGISIVLAIIKPIANFAAKIEDYAKLYGDYATTAAGYEQLTRDITKLKARIRHTCVLPREITEILTTLRTKAIELAAKGDKNPVIAMAKQLQAQVNHEIPPTSFWLP